MKFGGSSVAAAERILAVAEIVRERLERRPVVIVSALEGVTDLLESALAAACRGDREALDPTLADIERRHRWALAGSIQDAGRRHQLSLDLGKLFEDLRQQLRSIRVLGEATPRARDGLMAFGETLSARLVGAAFADAGLPAKEVDPREVILTEGRHGCAVPVVDGIRDRARRRIGELLEQAVVPVLGGFVGATEQGVTTTLGRGGSDTSAAVLGAAMEAEEIQIWTDVDGLMSADPRLVPAARTLPRVSFAEAAELAFYGARVLHPASIAPAVQREIPVRVLNSMRPEGEGTVVLGEAASEDRSGIAAVVSRAGLTSVRITSRRMSADPAFLPRVLGLFEAEGLVPELVLASEVSVGLVAAELPPAERLAGVLGDEFRVCRDADRAIICVVGSRVGAEGACRGQVLSALAEWEPELVGVGGSATSVAAVVPAARLEPAVRALHARFFEGPGVE